MDERKKMTDLYILEILRKYTDEFLYENGNGSMCMSQAEIGEKLQSEYDIYLDRKAVSRGLSDLVDSPVYCNKIYYDSNSRRAKTKSGTEDSEKRTNFRYEHDFDAGQIRMLMDAVLFSKNISDSESRDLIGKIGSLSPVGKASRHFSKLSEMKDIKVTSDSVIGNIDILDEALDKKCKVEFIYNDYGTDKKLHPKCDADGIPVVMKASPYNMVANDGRFYLVAGYDDHDNAVNIRIDKMTDVHITGESVKPRKEIKGLNEGLRTMAEQIYMLAGESETVVFRASTHIVSQVVDWFGKTVRFSDENDGFVTCTVKVNPKAMRYWVMQYSDYVEILEPQHLRDDVKNAILVAWRKYKDNGEEIMLNDAEIDRIIAGWKEISSRNYEKLDVSKLGEIVRKTHIAFLPFKYGSDKEMPSKYKELLLTLYKIRNNGNRFPEDSDDVPVYEVVERIEQSLIDFVDKKPRFSREMSDDILISVHLETRDATIDINNFEDDFVSVVEAVRIRAEERRARFEEFRKKRQEERQKKLSEENSAENHPIRRGAPKKRNQQGITESSKKD